MFGGVFAFSVFSELVLGGWWITASPWAFIPHIGPDACCRAPLFGLHLDRGVICEDGLPASDKAAESLS